MSASFLHAIANDKQMHKVRLHTRKFGGGYCSSEKTVQRYEVHYSVLRGIVHSGISKRGLGALSRCSE